MSNTGNVWLLTGTSSNFGIALTRELLKAGHRVVATARTPSKIPFEENESLLIVRLDVNDPSSISSAFEETKKRFGRIDVVVNKAGANHLVELEALPEAKGRKIFDAQLWGPARVQELATAMFEAQGTRGLVLNITSAMATFGAPLITVMAAPKAGSEVLTLARARASPFVTAVNVRPGGFEEHPLIEFEPQPAAYSAKEVGRTLTGTMRNMLSNQSPGIGNVNKMAAALVALAGLPREQLPGAVLLGSDSFSVGRAIARKRIDHISQGQRLLQDLKKSGVQFTGDHVWFVTNANSALGRTLVRLLLEAGQHVAAAVSGYETPSSFTPHNQLLIIRPESISVDSSSTALNNVVDHFGRVDVIVNAPVDEAQSQIDDWESTYALAERVFWSPINMNSATIKVLRERNPIGAGGRIFNILTTASAEDSTVAVHSALNAAVNLGTTSLYRELPRKWNIGVTAITMDSELHSDEETVQTLRSLADLPRAALPSLLVMGPRALGSAQHAAQIELSETCSKQAMARASSTDRDYVDSTARIGLYQSLMNIILSPSPSFIARAASALAAAGWGARLALFETVKGLVVSRK